MRVDHVLAGASGGDAITAMALRLRDELAAVVDGDVFALHIAPDVADEVRPFRDITEIDADGPVIYHLSIGCGPVVDWLLGTDRPILVDYHNITPPKFFAADPDFAFHLAQGRAEMAQLASVVGRAVADSAFNARELERVGYRDVHVAAPVVPIDELLALTPHPPTQHHFDTMVDGPVLMFVGQLLPHKGIDRLIEAFHLLVSHHRPDAKLLIVGAARNAAYARALELQIRELNLANAWMTGKVADDELVAYFRRANLFVTMSEHEGFCFPIVEAFAFGVPVLANGVAALPDTVGDAGIVLPHDEPIEAIAEVVHEMLGNERLRSTLVDRGLRRAEHFGPHRSIRRHLELITEVL